MVRAVAVILAVLSLSVSVRSQGVPGRSPVVMNDARALNNAFTSSGGQREPRTEVKSQALALSFSMIVPGLGQAYNGEVDKAIVFATLFWGGVYMVDAAKITREHESITAFGWLSVVYIAGVYAWNLLDAPLSAKRINESANSGVSVSPALFPGPGTYAGGLQVTIRF